jgi:hypothetical protein
VVVSPFLFNRKTTSDLGWAFIGLIDGGRIKEYADDGSDIIRIDRHQLLACTYEVLPGPGKLLRCSVPAGRDHDDLLIGTALTARFDAIGWRVRTARGTGPNGASLPPDRPTPIVGSPPPSTGRSRNVADIRSSRRGPLDGACTRQFFAPSMTGRPQRPQDHS